jgi:uncharacterized protein YxjI
MRARLFDVGDDFWIDTDDDRHAFKVDGKALRIRKTFILENADGDELIKIKERKLSVRDKMELEHDGQHVGTIKKALVSPLRDRFAIELDAGGDLSAKGNVLDHEYKIERDGHTVAEISKRWFRIRDTYGIEVAPGEDDALILAAAVCIDEMARL